LNGPDILSGYYFDFTSLSILFFLFLVGLEVRCNVQTIKLLVDHILLAVISQLLVLERGCHAHQYALAHLRVILLVGTLGRDQSALITFPAVYLERGGQTQC
jgi:hypothetical protein